ncbi:DEAD/DEAH box helicase [Falsiroseomonas sp. HC035]|uniref:DEAD/DEAH box helicase n=1 Tax=Falsiroseomonas sp. HC035 TaxID=3390999 RepID=UPI003D30FB63
MSALDLRLTPHGNLVCEPRADAPGMDQAVADRLQKAFARGSGDGLLRLGAGEVGTALPPVFAWWRDFAARYVAALCVEAAGAEDSAALPKVSPPNEAELGFMVLTAPIMPGAEYLAADVLRDLWHALATTLAARLAASRTGLQEVLKDLNPAWNLVGRVHFNLAENRRDPDAPFAFLATYVPQLSAQARVQHQPLGQALREYGGAANRGRLLSLLLPVQRAAETCDWLRELVDRGEIFHPLRWCPGEAWRLLASAEALERAGVVLRMPAGWAEGRPPRPQATATVGARAPSKFGLDSLLDFRVATTLDGEELTETELRLLLAGTENLVLLRGRWVEVDRAKLQRTLDQFRAAEAMAEKDGLPFAEAMRLLAGTGLAKDAADATRAAEWSRVTAGPWLAETLRGLRAPEASAIDPGPALQGTLRPYQKAGLQWLHLLSGLGLGGCLADDMGLGKTIQVLALLLVQRREAKGKPGASLLVAPASLLANWAAEIARFAPVLRARILHPSAMPAAEVKRFSATDAAGLDLVITSYGSLLRLKVLAEAEWRLAIFDEAQALKNPVARQTRAVRALKARARIALTGTPVENSLGDLWSIFDVINPGLLGTAKQFTGYTKGLTERAHNPYGPLRELVRPYILRRMKTDRAIIADLPDKTEVTAHCHLSRRQAALYAQAVEDLSERLDQADGMQRRGLVLASLMRFKQICNHPSHWLNDGGWAEAESGKFGRLRDIAEVVAARQEKMLVFTQFKEATQPLATFLGSIFGRAGLVLHGATAVKQRQALVREFQDSEAAPFFVLSLKAGGAGLTLTAASHVVHFDRWWNPAVENQATDRAFRIGQKRNVLVHKFVCRGTVEERIGEMIDTKRSLSDAVLAGGEEINVTDLSDEALLRLVALDLNSAMGE